MSSDWKTFIQVNIFGCTLQEMHQKGIVLESVLENIGCRKFSIVEVALHRYESSSSKNRSEPSDSADDLEPVLSTTMATSGGPRFSTPRTSRHFTMNFTTNISRIHSEEDRIDGKSVSSGTIQYEPSEVSTVSRDDTESVVKSVVDKLLDRVERNVEHLEWKSCELTRSATAQPTKSVQKKNKRRRSAPEERLQTLTEDSDHEQFKYSNPLKKRSSEARCYKPKSVCDQQIQNSLDRTSVSPILSQAHTLEQQSKRFYHNLLPISTINWDEPIAYSYDQNDFSREDYAGDDEFFSMNDNPDADLEETLDMITYTPPPPTVLPSTSILKQLGKRTQGNKAVSFKSPERSRRADSPSDHSDHSDSNKACPKEMNKLYDVKCHFPGCEVTYKWRKRYGKIRLMDHAISHLPDQQFKCSRCDFTTQSVRNMRYHHKKNHNERASGLGMRKLLRHGKEQTYLKHTFNLCFQKNKSIGLKAVEENDSKRNPVGDSSKEGNNDKEQRITFLRRII